MSNQATTVHDADGRRLHYVPPSTARAIRYLAARLEAGGGVPKTLAFTSALQGEGVTFTSRSFGTILAHDSGRTVCVADVNWWDDRPSVRRPPSGGKRSKRPTDETADQSAAVAGLNEVLQGKRSLNEAIQHSGDSTAAFLRAGTAEPLERTAFARSRAMADVLDELRAEFDHVVLDLPPALKTSDALVLAGLADTTILVARQGVTTVDQVDSALREMENVTLARLVLNTVQSRIPRPVRRLVGVN